MKTKEYHIKIYSISRFIISFIITWITFFYLISDLLAGIENRILYALITLGTLVAAFYFSSLIGQARIKLVFTKEALLHVWESHFWFSWEKDISIPWEIIDTYVFEEDRTWDSFIINLTTKLRYKIDRLNIIPVKDDFDKLVKDFPNLSNHFKEGVELSHDTAFNSIKEGVSKYQSKSYKQGIYILTIAFIILFIFKITNSGKLAGILSLGVIGSAIAYYWSMINAKK